MAATSGRRWSSSTSSRHRRSFALAKHATKERGAAEQALLQAYLAIFEDAGRFDPATDDPAAWLRDVLIRHLPSLPPASKSSTIEPVEPPAELWQRLDIALGLKRLDRHIKPGIATQERGRDPMPNAADQQADRQLRFWRATSGVALVALTASIGLLALLLTPDRTPRPMGPIDPQSRSGLFAANVGRRPGSGTHDSSGLPAGRSARPRPPGRAKRPRGGSRGSAAPRRAILQPSDESRLWHVVLDGSELQVDAMPPFTAPAGADGENVLTLWAVADNGAAMHRLAELDPADDDEARRCRTRSTPRAWASSSRWSRRTARRRIGRKARCSSPASCSPELRRFWT